MPGCEGEKMKLAALFSGGKDSTLSVYMAIKQGHEVAYLITMVPENPESYMFHYPNIKFTKLQADAIEIPLIFKKTKGEKEKELGDLENVLNSIKSDIDGVVAGAIASRYQYERVKKLCEDVKLKVLAPLWGIRPETMWNELLTNNFHVIIASVSAEGLGKEWLGKKIDWHTLEQLKILSKKFSFHLGFEGGEAETFVTNCPIFKKKIKIKESKIIWDSKSETGYFIIKKAALEDK
jgi:ABC transporter with metal-binding/Fe-S-binding domain ATP-binding protein